MTISDLLYVGDDAQTISQLVSLTEDICLCVVKTPERAINQLTTEQFDALILDDSVEDPTELLRTVDHRIPSLAVLVSSDLAASIPDELYDVAHPTDGSVDVESLVKTVTVGASKPTSETALTLTGSGQPGHASNPSSPAIVENSAFAQTILNGLPDVLFVADTDGTLLRWNERLNIVTGYSDEAIAQMRPTEFFAEEDAEKIQEAISRLGTERTITVTAQLITPNSGTVPYEITASVVELDNNCVSICGVARDITERREAERQLDRAVAELERSNTELEQFAYVASHDMKEPLRMVSSYLELLERRYASELDENAQEFIGFAVEGAGRMREMINGLLAYSRVGRQTEDFQRVHIEEVIETAQSNLRIAIEESDALIKTDEDLPVVFGDAGQLTQLFQNLIANAIKYTDEGRPSVLVSATRIDDGWQFAVSDNGIGIPETEYDSIFEIFSGEGGQNGSGIGLAICEKIVGHHDGRIWVDSTVGEGSTFYFTIPDYDKDTDSV